MTKAPISFFLSLDSLLIKRSSIGTRKASVLPEPVTASTTTSLCCIKRGIVDACTGVIWVKPIELMTSRIHGVSDVGSDVHNPANAFDCDILICFEPSPCVRKQFCEKALDCRFFNQLVSAKVPRFQSFIEVTFGHLRDTTRNLTNLLQHPRKQSTNTEKYNGVLERLVINANQWLGTPMLSIKVRSLRRYHGNHTTAPWLNYTQLRRLGAQW